MRYIPTSRLKPGMALGQDIYDGAGRLLLAKHLLLTSGIYIQPGVSRISWNIHR